MSRSKIITFLLLAYFVVGCSSGTNTTVSSLTPYKTATDVATVTPLATDSIAADSPTPTPPLKPTDTLMPTETSTPISLPISNLTQKCLTIQPDLPPDFLSAGKVLFSDETEQVGIRGSITEISNQNQQFVLIADAPLFFDPYWGSFVSPHRRFLAYKTVVFDAGEIVDNRLVVIDGNGQTIAAMDWEDNWLQIEGWLDMDHLILSSTDHAWPGVHIVNPFSRQSQAFSPALPEIYIDPLEQEKGIVKWKLVLESSRSQVGYVQSPSADTPYDINMSFVLWNLQTEQSEASLSEVSVAFTDKPSWSPDGSQLAMIVQDKPDDNFERFELFILDPNGEIRKWVDLSGSPDIGLGKMRWSPDGRYIAIGGAPLIILDTISLQVWDFCVSAGFYESPIYWSPDSTQILTTLADKSRYPEPGSSIVIDVEPSIAAQLYPDRSMRPIGWLEADK